jgi:hypothetical protein
MESTVFSMFFSFYLTITKSLNEKCKAVSGMFCKFSDPDSQNPNSPATCTRPQEPNSPAAKAPEAEFSSWAWHFKTFQTLSIPAHSTLYNWTVNTFTVR